MAISSALSGAVGQVPAGSVTAFAGANAPSGWLLCAGQAVSRTQYSSLFLTIGTTYGVGDGSTTFNVPDLRGRVVAGLDNMNGSAASRLTATTITGGADALGEVGGAQTHLLTASESGLPEHNHAATSTSSSSASHTFGGRAGAGYGYNAFDGSSNVTGGPYYNGAYIGSYPSVSVSTSTSTSISNNTAANAASAHNNVQPTMVLNYIIKA